MRTKGMSKECRKGGREREKERKRVFENYRDLKMFKKN